MTQNKNETNEGIQHLTKELQKVIDEVICVPQITKLTVDLPLIQKAVFDAGEFLNKKSYKFKLISHSDNNEIVIEVDDIEDDEEEEITKLHTVDLLIHNQPVVVDAGDFQQITHKRNNIDHT